MSQFKGLYISNILECFYRGYVALPVEKRIFWMQYDTSEANRALLYGGNNKVVITSIPIEPAHLENIQNLMNWTQVENLYPTSHSPSICEDIVNDEKLQSEVLEVIRENPDIKIIPYRSSPEFYRLIEFLKTKELKFETPETIPPDLNFIISYGNSKRGFRHLWYKAKNSEPQLQISIPEGFITADKSEAIEACWWFQKQKRSFVLKTNNGTQGIGVVLCNRADFPQDKKSFRQKLDDIVLKDGIWNEPVIIVEELLDTDKSHLGGSPSPEFKINDSGKVSFLYPCEQVIAPDNKTFKGIYIHPELLKDKLIIDAQEGGIMYGKELSHLGYRGYFDMDTIITKQQKIFAVETNLRRTGGTHVHELASTLFGKNYFRKKHIVGEDIDLSLERQLIYEECFYKLGDLLYDKSSGTGLIFGNPDMLRVGILNVILIANTAQEMKKLRETVCKAISS